VEVAMGVAEIFPGRGQPGHFAYLFEVAMQVENAFTKRFTVCTPQRKCPMKAHAPFASILKSFSSQVMFAL